MKDQAKLNDEQKVCIKCGLCCDGTLFDHALLDKGEKPNLPKLMQQQYFKTDKKEAFRLPCPYFDKKCTIYRQQKAHVCSSFRCELLKEFSKSNISLKDAQNVVENAITLRSEIFELYTKYKKSSIKISFRELLKEISQEKEKNDKQNITNQALDLIYFKTNILEILLIKHFKPKKEFDNLLMS